MKALINIRTRIETWKHELDRCYAGVEIKELTTLRRVLAIIDEEIEADMNARWTYRKGGTGAQVKVERG